MEVFRITLRKYSETLYASGMPNRWNFKDEKVIYTASSRSLACLENVVHSSGEALHQPFKILVIYIPDHIFTESISLKSLPAGWNLKARPKVCQNLGSAWLSDQKSLLLKVPSAIVNKEFNFILNVNHPDFKKVKIIDREDFAFDRRSKQTE
jgi:RES domain-containing protein